MQSTSSAFDVQFACLILSFQTEKTSSMIFKWEEYGGRNIKQCLFGSNRSMMQEFL